jgi:hypothetical protein
MTGVMKGVVWSVTGVAGLVGVVALIGWLLPTGHVASRRIHLPVPPEAVYETVRDVAAYPSWRTGVTRVDVLESAGGRIRFREHSADGPIEMEIVEASRPKRMVTRIADPDQPFGGTWTFEIEGTGEGSTVTITERGEVYNPIFRFVGRFVLGYHATLDRYLEDLRRRLSPGS